MSRTYKPNSEKDKASDLQNTKVDHPWRQSRLSRGVPAELEDALLLEELILAHGNVTVLRKALRRKHQIITSDKTLRRLIARPDFAAEIAEARTHAVERLYECLEELAQGASAVDPMTGESFQLPPDRLAIMDILKALDPERWDARVRALAWEKKQSAQNGRLEEREIIFRIAERKTENGTE